MSGVRAAYPVPPTLYKPIHSLAFWRLAHKLQSAASYGHKTSSQGEYQRYGGGGVGDQPTHLGAICWMDSTPVKKTFFVDDDTGIPIGNATMTLMTEHLTGVVPGFDLCAGACTSSAILRTVLSANKVKEVPADLLEIDPNLPYLRLRPDLIRFDNATETHGRTVEDNLADAYIGTEFVGSKMARDKPIERIMGVFLNLLFEHQEDANYDIARMRLYGFDARKHKVICSLRTAQRLLARAVLTYNMTRSRGRGRNGRQPALVWRNALKNRKLNVLKDVDKFQREIGTVKFLVMNNSGIEMFGRRYTPGSIEMKRILQDFQRGLKLPKGDVGAKPRTNRDDRKRLKYDVKLRYNEDDLGFIRVWNPHVTPARWEDFECVDPFAHGLPKWLDEQCREFATREAMEYLSVEGEAIVRSRLFEDIANVDSMAAERDRQTLAKALHDPRIRKVMAGYVQVADEVVEEFGIPEPEASAPAPHELATGARKDAHIKTPRAKSAKPDVVTMRPAHGSVRRPVQPAPRYSSRKMAKTADRRDPSPHTNSATRPNPSAPARARRKHLKWGDQM